MSDEQVNQTWRTPDDFFNMLDAEVGGFDIDVAADYENTKCNTFRMESGMYHINNQGYYPADFWGEQGIKDRDNEDWFVFWQEIRKAWCNPPYKNPVPWVKKAIEQVNKYPGTVVYMLLNHDASTKWYSEALEHASEIRILTKKRIQFIAPDGITPSSNSKGQCVIVFRNKQLEAPCHVWHWDWAKTLRRVK